MLRMTKTNFEGEDKRKRIMAVNVDNEKLEIKILLYFKIMMF